MSMYGSFKTSPDAESKGVEIHYGSFIVTIARSGGANSDYKLQMTRALKPFRRAIQNGTMSDEQAEQIMMEVFAKSVIRNWQVVEGDVEKVGIESEEGKILPFNLENVMATFKKLPDLYHDLVDQSKDINLFKENVLEEDAKN